MVHIKPGLANRLNRGVNRTGPQHPEARRVTSKATTRDIDPLTGSQAIMHEFTSSSVSRQTSSLNVTTSTGAQDKGFHWGVMGFGWGDGIL